MQSVLERLAAIDLRPRLLPVGRVIGVRANSVRCRAAQTAVRLGDWATVWAGTGRLPGVVVRIDGPDFDVLLDSAPQGVAIDNRVVVSAPPDLTPDDSWVGRVIDPFGRPLDGAPIADGPNPISYHAAPLPASQRRGLGARLETGFALFNTLLPLVRGQRMGLFAGSGVGKSTLLAQLATGVEADVTIIALVGERGREVGTFVRDTLGDAGMARSIVVAATSDQPAFARRHCALTATALAEFYRDQGRHVLLLIDSVTRFCEAHRELAVASGEEANLRGHPPSTAHAIAQLCERAGPGADGAGDITAIYSVLVQGSDMEEPVADMLRGVLDGHIVLDREIAERGRFPAVDVVRSVSRALPGAASPRENETIARARGLMGEYARAELMIQSGLYVAGSDAGIDAAIRCRPALEVFCSTQDGAKTAAHFIQLQQALSGASNNAPPLQ